MAVRARPELSDLYGESVSDDRRWDWSENVDHAWRVGVFWMAEAEWLCLTMEFGRLCDAELAAEALNRIGCGTWEGCLELGPIAVRREMIEALNW